MEIALPLRGVAAIAMVLLLSAGLATAEDHAPRLAQATPEAAARAQRLDELFASLKALEAEEAADAAIAEIWTLWLQSGRPEIDATVEQAARLIGAGLSTLALPLLDDVVA